MSDQKDKFSRQGEAREAFLAVKLGDDDIKALIRREAIQAIMSGDSSFSVDKKMSAGAAFVLQPAGK